MNPLDIFKDPKKREIENQLRSLGITKDYTINKDYTVDLAKDTIVIVKKIEECPVEFNLAHGNFIWHYSDLKSVKNLPKKVLGNFSIAGNKIKSLKNSPTDVVDGKFNCSGNKLKNLNGSPRKCGDFIASGCDLESLEGAPNTVNGDFIVSKNKLQSLKGSPKSINGTFDCSLNDLKTIDYLPKCKKSITSNNPLEEKDIDPTQIHIEFGKFDLKDKVTYNKPGSKFNMMTGEIVDVDNSTIETIYQIHFRKSENPSLERDATVSMIKEKFVEKPIQILMVDDDVIYNNPNSKYNGYKGKIVTKDETGDEPIYKIKFIFDENPGIVNIVSDANKNKTFVNVGKIKGRELDKIETMTPVKESPETTDDIIKDPSNTWDVGDEAICLGEKVKLISLKTPTIWNVRISDRVNSVPYGTHYNNLTKVSDAPEWVNISPTKTKPVETFKVGDKIIYLDPDGAFDECKGVVNNISWQGGKQSLDIRIVNKFGITEYIYSVNPNKLEKDAAAEAKSKEGKFKKGDKVIYISKTSDDKNKDLHLCKGVITYANDYGFNRDSYDVKFPKQNNIQAERTAYLVPIDNLILDIDDFKVGDKVVYNNDDDDDDFNGQVGIVKLVKGGIYNVMFNHGETTMTITGILPSDLTKFIKPIGSEVHINDDIIYTKPDSKHFGCKGTVTAYKIGDAKPFDIEIISKDKKLVKLKTSDENLEFVPPPRIFKKGDKIRYINSDNPSYDGLIGTVDKVLDKGKNKQYEVILKSAKNALVYLTTHAEFLLLLEEAADSENIKFGQKVKYINPNSKYNDKIGEYQGERLKDGKKQYSVKFDEGSIWKTIFFDEDEGTIEPTGEAPKSTTATYSTTYTEPAKKKKKKEEEPPRPPVLVYNRRNVARKSYRKPDEFTEPSEETKVEEELKVGDNVKVITKYNNIESDKGKIVRLPTDDNVYYVVSINGTNFYMFKHDIIKDETNEIGIGDTVTILDSATSSYIGKKGIVKDIRRDGRYVISNDKLDIYLLKNQIKKSN